jgi:hypothetical protein
MAMERDWAAGLVSACASARDPSNDIMKHRQPKSTPIASGEAVRALFARRANGLPLSLRQ